MTPLSAPDLVSLFAAAAARDNARAALVFAGRDGGETWSYSRLFAAARWLAGDLRRRGLGRGDRVGCLLGSSPEVVVAYLAILACGAAMVPINLGYRRREIAHILGDAEPRLLIVGREQLAAVGKIDAGERASVEEILVAEKLVSRIVGEPDDRSGSVKLPVKQIQLASPQSSRGALIRHLCSSVTGPSSRARAELGQPNHCRRLGDCGRERSIDESEFGVSTTIPELPEWISSPGKRFRPSSAPTTGGSGTSSGSSSVTWPT